jgi:hypothetical protein
LDKGEASCADLSRLQKICDRLSPTKIDALLRWWLARLPHLFTRADRVAGYRYDISMLQVELSSLKCSMRRCRAGCCSRR